MPTTDVTNVRNGPLIQRCAEDVCRTVAAANLPGGEPIVALMQVCASLMESIAASYGLDRVHVVGTVAQMMGGDPGLDDEGSVT